MPPTPEIYADAFVNVRFVQNMVRIDLASVTDGQARAGGPLPTEVHHRLVLNPQAFLQALGTLQELAQRLIDAGVLRREGGAQPAPAAAKTDDGPSSPNF